MGSYTPHWNNQKYHPECDEIAKRLGKLGFRDCEISAIFGIAESTLKRWKKNHPSFNKALKEGKLFADLEVMESVHQRATGYSYEEVTKEAPLFEESDGEQDGALKVTKIVKKHVPADATLARFWLQNRQRALFRETKNIELSGVDGGEIESKSTVVMSPMEAYKKLIDDD